jgi:hypothetical protein
VQRQPVVDAWADQFEVKPDEVLSQVRLLRRLIDGVDDQVLRLRLHVYAGPDHELDESVRVLHERVHDSSRRIRELHAQVIRERL